MAFQELLGRGLDGWCSIPLRWLGWRGSCMLECLLLLIFTGLLLASRQKMGLANPFQIYFFVWFFVFFGYYILRGDFISVSNEFLILMLAFKALAFLFFVVTYLVTSKDIVPEIRGDSGFQVRSHLVLAAQIAVVAALPFVYERAVYLAGGDDVFSVLGYKKLRGAWIEGGEGFSYFSYFFVLAFVLSSIQLQSYLSKASGLLGLIVSIVTGVLYTYFSTGRTFVLFFALIMFVPLVMRGVIKTRGILLSALLVVCLFVFVAAMNAKGISLASGFSENLESFLENLKSYTIAPVLALFGLMNTELMLDYGLNSLRGLIAVLYSFGLIESPPVNLIKNYEFVPNPTNVYTVYEVYFRDFYYFGLLIPPLFLLIHWWLYAKALRIGGRWVFYYAASVYPLLMQFFQDQYFSLFSMWVQVGFWYWLFLKSEKQNTLSHA
jgi:oligosaccharide repeat unit polymerase